MTKNRLSDLNDHLFAQLERLADEDNSMEQIEKERTRAEVMVGVADKIIQTAAAQLQVAKFVSDFDGADPRPYLKMMEHPSSATGERPMKLVGTK